MRVVHVVEPAPRTSRRKRTLGVLAEKVGAVATSTTIISLSKLTK